MTLEQGNESNNDPFVSSCLWQINQFVNKRPLNYDKLDRENILSEFADLVA